MRRQLLGAIAASLSLVQCSFISTGLTADSGDESTTSATSTGDPPATDPTTGDPTDPPTGDCGNFQIEPGEECDNGENNNGNGNFCRENCIANVCGDGYLASSEGCDDGNTDPDDGCGANCELPNCTDGKSDPGEDCDDGNKIDDDGCTNMCKLPACGDGIVNGDDECDDGMNAPSSACVPGCKNATCGDGFQWDGNESCDDGNMEDDDECNNMCKAASCGDGVVQDPEACDDGNMDNTDACLASCEAAACGDGNVWAGMEECDDSNEVGTDACVSCKSATCGDGEVWDGNEECDDGNLLDNDGCLATCVPATCGDGKVWEGTEECDDGENDVLTDACLPGCKAATCGDGHIQDGDEECDDGNTDDGDSCDSDCKRVAYYIFVSSDQYDGDFGGVGGADDLCNELAEDDLPGVYKAWMSGDGANNSAASRLFKATDPYIRPDGMKIADNWADLVDPDDLQNPIKLDESGAAINAAPNNCMDNAGEALVWTGTLANGTKDSTTCMNWGSASMNQEGTIGLLNKVDGLWTNACKGDCNTQARIYCVEQPAN